MVSLQFTTPEDRTRTIGPVPYFTILGNSLRQGPQDREIARHQDGTWDFNGQHYITLTVAPSVRVRFEDRGAPCAGPYGPYSEVMLADGSLWQGGEDGRLLAHFDPAANSWYVYPADAVCPAMHLEPL